MEEIIGRIMVFQVLTDILSIVLGTGLVFGALKWSKGLISITALYWGAFLGLILGFMLFSDDFEFILCTVIIGAILLPILTYTVAGVNRFILGFIVTNKFMFLITVPMFKDGNIEPLLAIALPLIIGTIAGIGFMSWTKVRVSVFIFACAFLGATEIAPVAVKYINQILYGVTGDSFFMYNPLDFIFAFMKIELTDWTTLVVVSVLTGVGVYKQFNSVITQLKAKGYKKPLEVPLITYETLDKNKHGKID